MQRISQGRELGQSDKLRPASPCEQESPCEHKYVNGDGVEVRQHGKRAPHHERRRRRPVLLALALLLSASGLAHSPVTLAEQSLQAPAQGQQVSQQQNVNINTADAEALAAGLVGVGPSRAEEIVRYRQTYGPFASAEELMEVKGIGPSTLEKNRKVITLE